MTRARLAIVVPLAAAAACLGGCSALLDWGDFSGGMGDAGGGADASTVLPGGDGGDAGESGDASSGTCGTCWPAAPSGWTGPVSLYVGAAAPPCSKPAFGEGFGGLQASPATCASCFCESPAGVDCAEPVMSFYVETTCNVANPAGGSLSVGLSCASTPLGTQAVKVAAPQISGGTCAADGGAPTTPQVSWKTTGVYACPAAKSSGTCAAGGVCASPPPSGVPLCVTQPGVAASCPGAYPNGPSVFYTGADDTRGCSTCTCGPPSGGSCSIASPAVDTYGITDIKCVSPAASQLDAPNACAPLTGPDAVMLIAVPTLVSAGACAVSGGGQPTGGATPTGAQSFCCAP